MAALTTLIHGTEYDLLQKRDGTIIIRYSDGVEEPHDDMGSAQESLKRQGLMHDKARVRKQPVSRLTYYVTVACLLVLSELSSLAAVVAHGLSVALAWGAAMAFQVTSTLRTKLSDYRGKHMPLEPPPF